MSVNRKERRRAEALARKSSSARTRETIASKPQRSSFGTGTSLRAALLGTVAVTALVTAQPRLAVADPDACVTAGVVATCQGDQSDGLTSQGGGPDFNTPAVTTLNVNSLTANVAPGVAGVDGIEFNSTGSVTINSDTGAFAITTTGNNAEGIFARSMTDGTVDVTSVGNITTDGIDAEGIEATNDVGSMGDIDVVSTGNIMTGGGGADGILAEAQGNGSVAVTSMGNISTNGNDAHAIYGLAHGDGNLSVTSTGDISTKGTYSDGIDARKYGVGSLSVSSVGTITTTRDDSIGIFGLSVGDGAVNIMSSGDIATQGDYANGIVGLQYGIGNVTVTSTGNITTSGYESEGLIADNMGSGDATLTSVGNVSTTGDISIGLFGRAIGNVAITSTGNVSTAGYGADAVVGVSYTGDVAISSTGNVATAGAFVDGITGYAQGGTIRISVDGDVITTGDGSDGIDVNNALGAGSATITIAAGSTISGGINSGDGIDIDGGLTNLVTNRGTVTTLGENAIEGTTGNETVVNFGSVIGNVHLGEGGNIFDNMLGGQFTGNLTTGAGKDMFANSGTFVGSAMLGDGDDIVSLDAAGTVSGATFDGGADNDLLRFNGAGTNTLDGSQHSNFEFLSKTGASTWTLTGTHNLTNTATIQEGTLDLQGSLNSPLVTNRATLAAGGVGAIGNGAIMGNFVQTATGVLAADVDLAGGTGDLLTVTGTANLAGNVAANFTSFTSGAQQVTILSAAGGTTNNGLGLTTNTASPLIDAQLLFPNATDVVIGVTVDFTPMAANLNPNQTNIANNLGGALIAGGGALAPVLDSLLLGITSFEQYKSALDQLSPEVFLNTETTTLFAADDFTQKLFSCRVPGAGHSFVREGQCGWVRIDGDFLDRDRTANNIGFNEESGEISAGAQFTIADGWTGGFGLGYGSSTLNTDTGAESEGNGVDVGGVLKYQTGPFVLAGAVSGGFRTYETTRQANFGGFAATAASDHDVTYLAGQLRVAYLLSQANWYAKPLVDFDLTRVDRDGFRETGGGAANLAVSESDETYFSVTPAVEFGAQYVLSPDTLAKPYIKAGVTFFGNNSHAVTAGFIGAPAGAGGFAINSEFDDTFADIEAGLALLKDNGTTLSFGYEGRIAEDTEQHGAFGKFNSEF